MFIINLYRALASQYFFVVLLQKDHSSSTYTAKLLSAQIKSNFSLCLKFLLSNQDPVKVDPKFRDQSY
jgi:hypothetical protein